MVTPVSPTPEPSSSFLTFYDHCRAAQELLEEIKNSDPNSDWTRNKIALIQAHATLAMAKKPAQ